MKKFIFLFIALSFITAALIFGYNNSFAANDTINTPMRIDTFGAGDVIINAGRAWIEIMTITAYTSAKTVTFIDDDGGVCLVLEVPAGYTISWPSDGSGPKEFTNGINFDDSASDLASNDYIFIWKSKTGR